MTNEQRACQVWAVLVYAASKRQILTYPELARVTGLAQNGMTEILGMVQSYCLSRKWPNLTSLVVSKKTHLPLKGCIREGGEEWAEIQFRAMRHPWGKNPGVYKLQEG